jgi:hypothetical protein
LGDSRARLDLDVAGAQTRLRAAAFAALMPRQAKAAMPAAAACQPASRDVGHVAFGAKQSLWRQSTYSTTHQNVITLRSLTASKRHAYTSSRFDCTVSVGTIVLQDSVQHRVSVNLVARDTVMDDAEQE